MLSRLLRPIENHPEPSEDHPEPPGDVWRHLSGATQKCQEMSRGCPKPSSVPNLSGIVRRQRKAVQLSYVATNTFDILFLMFVDILYNKLLFYVLGKCTAAMHLDVSVYGTPGSGFLMKPFFPVLNDTSLQEWPLVVLPGLHSVAATYGPFAARSDSPASKLFMSASGRSEIFGVQYVGNYAISAHLSTDVMTILQPRLQVVFDMGHATDDASAGHVPGDNFQQIRQLCSVVFIQKGSEELMSTCVMDVTSPETLCVASAVLPYHWWHPTLNHSVSVYHSVFSVAQDHHCAAVGIKTKTYEWFADSAREKQSYVGPVNLSASLANYEELREDQHLLIYVPTTAVSSRSVFHIPMKLQANSDLQIFVVQYVSRCCFLGLFENVHNFFPVFS